MLTHCGNNVRNRYSGCVFSVKDIVPVPLKTSRNLISSSVKYAELCESVGESGTFSVENTWAPADGRRVVGSKYEKRRRPHGRTNVVDLRGVFLRDLNGFYPANRGTERPNPRRLDTERGRSAGDYQTDATKRPIIPFLGMTKTEGEHSHKTSEYKFGNAKTGPHWEGRDWVRYTKVRGPGRHSHTTTITGGGDRETRPKNVAVYYYVKIN